MLESSKAKAPRTEFTAALDTPVLQELETDGKLVGWWRQPQRWQWGAVAVLTIIAFFMRRTNLGVQSLWFDEADLIARASDSLPNIFGNFLKAGENGPLYTLLMHFWLQIFGSGEVAVRTISMLSGTAAVPLIYLAGRKLGGGWVGLIAAFLLTISPYNIWYSQDAKMYPLALCLTMASVWLFLNGLEKGSWGWWLPYILITTLGFYIHVMAALIVAVEVVYYFATWRKQKAAETPPRRRRAYIALGLMTLPYLPIALWQLVALRDGTVGKTWFAPVSLPDMFNSLIRRFALNRSPEPWESLGAYTFLILVVLGLVWLWRSRKSSENQNIPLFLTLYLILPVLAFYILTTRIPLFADRYLLVASPAYYLLAAWGLVWLWKRNWTKIIAGLGIVLVVLTSYFALSSVNYSKEAQKEDWRQAMQKLSEWVRPGDVVVVVPGYLESAVNYYFKSTADVPVKTITQSLLAPKAIGDADDINLNDQLQKTIKGYERAWLVVSPDRYKQEDPQEFIRKVWFDNNTQMFADPQEFVGVKFYGYGFYMIPGTNSEFFPHTAKTDLKFGDIIGLEGYDLVPSAVGAGATLPPGTVKLGDHLHLSLYFRMLNPDKVDYEVTVRLVGKDGQDMDTSYTARPAAGYHPTTKWVRNEPVRDYREIYIKVPPGEYRLEVSIHPVGKSDAPLLVSGAPKVVLNTPIRVVS